MKPSNAFNIEFDYTLSDEITLKLTAIVELQHSMPHYYVTDFHLKNHPLHAEFLPDIDIMAIKINDGIKWIHTDSCKETVLSAAIGKAIEERGNFEIGFREQ
jgi:hypothetical protein